MHEDLLLRSPFCFYPYLPDGERVLEVFDVRDDDPRLTHQVQLTQAMTASLTDVVDEIGQLRMLLTSSYDHSDTLRNQMIRSDAALSEVR